MKEYIVEKEHDGKKLLRYLSQKIPGSSIYVLQKCLKNKDIKINNKPVKEDLKLQTGDFIKLFLPDKFINTQAVEIKGNLHVSAHQASNCGQEILLENKHFIYEDKSLIIINKPQALSVHPGVSTPAGQSLIEQARRLTGNPALNLAHRLDRNTGGLIVLGKNSDAIHKLGRLLSEQNMVKRYRCLVRGIPDAGEAVRLSDGDEMLEIKAFWEKSDKSDQVFIHKDKQKNDLRIITRYRVLKVYTDLLLNDGSHLKEPVSELEVELVTGRSHQIRAHLAFISCPILGDGKYGRNSFNLKLATKSGAKLRFQQLFATSLMFGSQVPKEWQYLKNKSFSIEPDYDIKNI